MAAPPVDLHQVRLRQEHRYQEREARNNPTLVNENKHTRRLEKYQG